MNFKERLKKDMTVAAATGLVAVGAYATQDQASNTSPQQPADLQEQQVGAEGWSDAGEYRFPAGYATSAAAKKMSVKQARIWASLDPSMKEQFKDRDVVITISQPVLIKGEHFPRSYKFKRVTFGQVLEARDPVTGKLLAREAQEKVHEYTEQKLYGYCPDTHEVTFTLEFFNEDGQVWQRKSGKRFVEWSKDTGYGKHEPTDPNGVKAKTEAATELTGPDNNNPFIVAVEVVEGTRTNGVSKSVSKNGKVTWTYETYSSNEEAKTCTQEKWEIKELKPGFLRINKVTMRADQSHYPQTASINNTFGKFYYQVSPDGQISIQTKKNVTERERIVTENECWSLDELVARFMKNWQKKVRMVFVLPWKSTPPRYPHGRRQQQSAQVSQADERAEKLERQTAAIHRAKSHKVKFYNQDHQHG